MYRQQWTPGRDKEPRNVGAEDVIGNTKSYQNWGGGQLQSTTVEENSELMFLGCMQVRLNTIGVGNWENQSPILIQDPENPRLFSQIPEISEKFQNSLGSQNPDTISVLFHIRFK